MRKNVRLGEVLVENQVITEEQLQKALEIQKKEGKRLGEVLTSHGMCSEYQMLNALAKRLNLIYEPNIAAQVDVEIAKIVPEQLVRKHSIAPLYIKEGVLYAATNDPLNFLGLDDIGMASGLDIEVIVSPKQDVLEIIDKLYAKANTKQVLENISNEYEDYTSSTVSLEDFEQVNDRIDASPVVQLVNSMIREAIQMNASDIHIEPLPQMTRVRFRVDGSLFEHTMLKNNIHELIVTRIKILAGLNIAEKRVPQDGGIALDLPGGKVDVRVSMLPTIYGEKVVLRLLGSDKNVNYDLKQLGFTPHNLNLIERSLYNTNGIILMTGPTGSGKTTTSYSILQQIQSPELNIVTIEDPVEKKFTNINQMQVNAGIGLTFASGLRSILRQDPDVILIGEIRDEETASIAIRSAITGHLVLSTLHTNDAVAAIPRLLDMGVPAYLLAAALRCVIAQRLVRKICPRCSHERHLTEHEKSLLNCPELDVVKEADGCDYCGHTGYHGRTAIHEVVLIDKTIYKMISSGDPQELIYQMAVKNGMTTLRSEGIRLLREGITNFDEVIKLIYSTE